MINIDCMKFLKRQFVRPVETVKRTVVFLTAALLISCSGGMDKGKVTPIVKPPVKTKTDESKEDAEKEWAKKMAAEEKEIARLEEFLQVLKRNAAAEAMDKYDKDTSGKLDKYEFCAWLFGRYEPPKKEQKPPDLPKGVKAVVNTPEIDPLALLYLMLVTECVSGLEKNFGKNEFEIEDIIKYIDPISGSPRER